jgi:hypothetical protein
VKFLVGKPGFTTTDKDGVFLHVEPGIRDLDTVPVPDPNLLRPMDEAARAAMQAAVDRHRAWLRGTPPTGLSCGALPEAIEIWSP